MGVALLQLGRHLGLETVATASAGKRDLPRAYGATAIDYRAPDADRQLRRVAGEGFDAAFDAIGLASFPRSHRLLKRGGTLVTYGAFRQANAIAKRTPPRFALFGLNYAAMLAPLALWRRLPDGRSARFFGIVDSREQHPERFARDLGYLLDLLAGGQVKPLIFQRFALDEAARAHEVLDGGRVRGQLVFVMADRPD